VAINSAQTALKK